MILPVVAYGHPILRKISEEIDESYPKLHELIANMYETMYYSVGVGLAAPQVGLNIRLFIIDASPIMDDEEEKKNAKKVFINPEIIEEEGEEWAYNEGCLSIPEIHEDVIRKPRIHIDYFDENFNHHDEWIDGINARVIQHEYDHLEGTLFVDKINTLKKTLLRRRLHDITKGVTGAKYKMIFPAKKKIR
ncbi:MAG: peptide deformylase [Saprospiraceae bacterium]|nr:peptide deformylase [Saprospiraceae bacterium]